jgi:hypothetical protein
MIRDFAETGKAAILMHHEWGILKVNFHSISTLSGNRVLKQL